MSQKEHWEQVYSTELNEKLGWYEPHLRTSLGWVEALNLAEDAPMIDVGGGASTLVDDLLDAGYRAITVVDISEKALSLAKTRLGKKAELVTWLGGDITSVDLPADHFELWHDRALFHFLTARDQQRQYRNKLLKALKPGGHLIVSTFAPEAPTRCSGLPVRRYNPEELENVLGEAFRLKRRHTELHISPGGVEQMYLYCHFQRSACTR